MTEENRAAVGVGLTIGYFALLLGIALAGGSEPAATVAWPAALALFGSFAALDIFGQSRVTRRVILHLALAVVFFGGLWFISQINPAGPLDGFIWPLSLIAAVLVVTLNIDRVGAAFQKSRIIVRRVAVGGVEVELDRGAVDRVERELSSSIRELFDAVDREYRRQVRIRRVEALLGSLYRQLPSQIFPNDTNAQKKLSSDSSLRATLHVPDVVFQEFMYQLTEYAPLPGGGSGRRFSKRRGIVGKCWRLKESLGQGDVFSGHSDKDRELRERWGMFDTETGSAYERPSCLTVILKGEDGNEVGLLYVDSKEKDAFGDDTAAFAIACSLEQNVSIVELGKAVGAVDSVMRELSSNLDLAKLAV